MYSPFGSKYVQRIRAKFIPFPLSLCVCVSKGQLLHQQLYITYKNNGVIPIKNTLLKIHKCFFSFSCQEKGPGIQFNAYLLPSFTKKRTSSRLGSAPWGTPITGMSGVVCNRSPRGKLATTNIQELSRFATPSRVVSPK